MASVDCSKDFSNVDLCEELPLEVWLSVFEFLKAHEEFPLATVCCEWGEALTRRRNRHKQKKWQTWVGSIANTVPRLEWAFAHGLPNAFPWNSRMAHNATVQNHLEVLKWAYEQGCPWNSEELCLQAMKHKDLAIIKWMRESGCAWRRDMCHLATNLGNLEALKWLREIGEPWNELVCQRAAIDGNLEMLMWARENGCPWNACTYAAAEGRGDVEMLQWLKANGCPNKPDLKFSDVEFTLSIADSPCDCLADHFN
jgi:hypothetical protein